MYTVFLRRNQQRVAMLLTIQNTKSGHLYANSGSEKNSIKINKKFDINLIYAIIHKIENTIFEN
jgi:hypothetical protein